MTTLPVLVIALGAFMVGAAIRHREGATPTYAIFMVLGAVTCVLAMAFNGAVK
jgi:hypothetical protein